MTQEIPKEKAKFLKRMAKQAGRSKEQTARTQNRKAAQKSQREAIAAMHSKIDREGPKKFEYSEKDLERIKRRKAQMMLPRHIKAQTALAAAAVTAEPAPHVHTAECNHAPMLEAVDAESTTVIPTETVLTPGILNEAMEKL